MKKKIVQHKLLSQMEGYNDEMKPEPLVNMAKLKAISIILLIILGSTFGVYYMGEWNMIDIDISHKADSNGNLNMGHTWVLGFLNTLIGLVGLCVASAICVGLYTLYQNLVKKFN